MIRLMIVSDNRLYREAISEQLCREKIINVVQTTSDEKSTIQQLSACNPDVILIDMTMVDCYKIISQINPRIMKTKVVALAMSEDDDAVLTCAKRGVAGYLTRNASLDHLINAITGVVEGELFCPRKIAEMLFNKVNSMYRVGKELDNLDVTEIHNASITLTQREMEIAFLLKCGKSNKEIARDLRIEISTVKNHVHNILSKMGVRNRIQAVNRLQEQFSLE